MSVSVPAVLQVTYIKSDKIHTKVLHTHTHRYAHTSIKHSLYTSFHLLFYYPYELGTNVISFLQMKKY